MNCPLGKTAMRSRTIGLVVWVGSLLFAVAAPAQEIKPLYFSTPTRSVAWFPLYVAMKLGFLQKEGISLQPIIMDSRVIVLSMASKEIPYSTGLGSTTIGASKELPLKLVMIRDPARRRLREVPAR